MSKFKQLRLKIEGKINGEEMTPLTIPMSRLLEYLTDLAAMMGHKEAVHFLKVEEGSTAPILLIDEDEESRIMHRMQLAKRGQGPREANLAYKRFDQRLRDDEGFAELIDEKQKINILEFPGRNLHVPKKYGPISEPSSLIGQLRRVGGMDATIPVWLLREDGEILCCEATESVCQQLAPLLFQYVRVHGMAYWTRDEDEKWHLERFRIQSFDPQPLSDDGFSKTLEKLRAIPDNGWSGVPDPLEELRQIRHGGDGTTQ
ncbi:MAG: hypothetical protein WAL32_14075 [Terriglobales bacterium]